MLWKSIGAKIGIKSPCRKKKRRKSGKPNSAALFLVFFILFIISRYAPVTAIKIKFSKNKIVAPIIMGCICLNSFLQILAMQ